MSLPEATTIVFKNMKLRTYIRCSKSMTSDSLKVQNLMRHVGETYRLMVTRLVYCPYCLLGAALQVLFPEVCLEFVLEKAWDCRNELTFEQQWPKPSAGPWHSFLAMQTSPDVKQTNSSDSRHRGLFWTAKNHIILSSQFSTSKSEKANKNPNYFVAGQEISLPLL